MQKVSKFAERSFSAVKNRDLFFITQSSTFLQWIICEMFPPVVWLKHRHILISIPDMGHASLEVRHASRNNGSFPALFRA